MTRTLAVIGLWIASLTTLCAQTDSLRAAPAYGDTIVSDVVAFGTDALLLATAPARFDGVDWAIAGSALAATAALVPLDDDVRAVARRNVGSDGDRIAPVANYYGTWGPPIILSGSLYLTGLFLDWPRVRIAGRHVAQAVVYAGLITTTVKLAVGRERPQFNGGQYVFAPFTTDDRYFSFPSGHATLAFAVSSSLAADIDHPAATVALYALASLTGLERMYSDRHWASDVLLGAIVGTACGYGVANLGSEEEHSLIVVPGVDRLTIVWRF
jgi:hypothetical protein